MYKLYKYTNNSIWVNIMRKAMIAIIIVTTLGFFIGISLYNIPNKKAKESVTKQIASNVNILEENKPVNSNEIKTTPNTIITTKVYYKKCNHVIKKSEKIDEQLINLKEEEFKEKNKEWDIKEFNEKNIIMYRQDDDYCREHYLLQDDNGCIAIYEINIDDRIINLYKKTDIVTKYLAEEDRKNLVDGVKVCGKEKLNKILEDYE